ncbi:uncharacterized protein LOC123523926 [Mercenaria mercenaria]|uniref:uncharacterized protein LOC123523926 n=1 Tax=Mercenaria mercenaria TaxID=6596 RepID=UPI00234ED9D8|nr:uncharacterized protein LOC123523926 [Mercenaria mercenaria]
MIFLSGLVILLSVHVAVGQGDAWLMNITSNIYGFPWIAADRLSDRNSSRFKEAQSFFCAKINDMFQSEPITGNPVKERYYRCFIDNFQQTNLHAEAPVSFTYSLVFNGSGPILKPIVDGVLSSNTETYHFGNKVWTLMGDWLISRVDVQIVSVNISNYLVKMEERQQNNMDVDTIVAMTVDLFNFTMTPELGDPTSPEFSKLAASFCKDISRYLNGKFPSYKGCNVTSIVNNTVEGKILTQIHLTFGWDQEVIFPHMVASMISHAAPKLVVDNKVVLTIGSVMILEKSLLNTGSGTAQDIKERPENHPCFPDKTNVILPDSANPSGYVICHVGNGFRFNCDQNQNFDSTTSKCVKRTVP